MVRRRQHAKGGAPGKAGGSMSGLHLEDEALWKAFTQGIEQTRFRPRVRETDVSSGAMRSASGSAESADGSRIAKAKPARANESWRKAVASRPVPAPKPTTPQQLIDSKAVRRLGNGRMAIDSRIDLHGLRQSEAYAELRRFLMRSVAKGYRMVLVITGKGSRARSSIHDGSGESFAFDGGREPGVLRRQVPMWLREPEFAAVVVGFTTAHVRHGGEGALYVQLRRVK